MRYSQKYLFDVIINKLFQMINPFYGNQMTSSTPVSLSTDGEVKISFDST